MIGRPISPSRIFRQLDGLYTKSRVARQIGIGVAVICRTLTPGMEAKSNRWLPDMHRRILYRVDLSQLYISDLSAGVPETGGGH
jgi:hypothetical protein